MFDSPENLALGFLTGVVFGFLLHRAHAARPELIIAQLLLKDFTVLKIMLTAIAVGSVGMGLLVHFGWATLQLKPLAFGGVVLGAIVFGIGLALLGYCPSTTAVACGEGRRDALAGLAGMQLGALLFVIYSHQTQTIIQNFGDIGAVTLPQLTGTSPWLWIAGLVLSTTALCLLIELAQAIEWRKAPLRRRSLLSSNQRRPMTGAPQQSVTLKRNPD